MRKGRQATGRATLTPVERVKGGKVYWAARGHIPVWEADGAVGSRRVERGFGVDARTETQRLAKCAAWNLEYEERFRNPKKLITFAKAYKTYLAKNHPAPWKGEEILLGIGEMQCSQIDDEAMVDLAEEIWPDGVAPSTLNRHLYSPVIAILHLALKEKAPELARPEGHNEVQPVIIPPVWWYKKINPTLNPSQRAFVFTLAMHGRRTSEMLGRRPADLDPESGILDLGRTKTGIRELALHRNALRLILAIPGWQKRDWLFGAGPNSDTSFRRDLKAACARVEAPWYHPHSFGRHVSVTRMLRAGYSVAHVADAHGMTPEMVTRRYGHLTKSETTAALHKVGGELYDTVFNNIELGGNEGENKIIESDIQSPNGRIMLGDLRA